MRPDMFLEDTGHILVGTATSSEEAMALAREHDADLALVDVHLEDGPSGVEVVRFIAERTRASVVFMTANPKLIPDDFSGAVGVIAKPHTQQGLSSALNYLVGAVLDPPPKTDAPQSLILAPAFEQQ